MGHVEHILDGFRQQPYICQITNDHNGISKSYFFLIFEIFTMSNHSERPRAICGTFHFIYIKKFIQSKTIGSYEMESLTNGVKREYI